jgi:hypothetical protein
MWYRRVRKKEAWLRGIRILLIAGAIVGLVVWSSIGQRSYLEDQRTLWMETTSTFYLGPVNERCDGRYAGKAVEVRCIVVDEEALYCRVKCRK